MDNDQIQGNEPAPEEPAQPAEGQQQPEPMPSSDQKPTEVQEPVPAADPSDDLALPEGVSERTAQQFEKLKTQLAEAKAQAAKVQASNYGTSVFDTFRAPEPMAPQAAQDYGALAPGQVDAIASQFIDPDGNVDVNGLNQALATANQQAQRAIAESRQTQERLIRLEESQEVKEAHGAHPELDPMSPNFDPKFFELVRDRVTTVRFVQGQNLSLKAIADDIRNVYQPTPTVNVAKEREQAINEYKNAQELRNQGPIESGRGEPRDETANLQDLRERTRQGDDTALTERLRKVGVIDK